MYRDLNDELPLVILRALARRISLSVKTKYKGYYNSIGPFFQPKKAAP